jgi:hypothetical protein
MSQKLLARANEAFFHVPFSIFHAFAQTRDAQHPSHGTAQNAKNLNVYGLRNDGTGLEGVHGGPSRFGSFQSDSNQFKAIQSNSNQNKDLPTHEEVNLSERSAMVEDITKYHQLSPNITKCKKVPAVCGHRHLTTANDTTFFSKTLVTFRGFGVFRPR